MLTACAAPDGTAAVRQEAGVAVRVAQSTRATLRSVLRRPKPAAPGPPAPTLRGVAADGSELDLMDLRGSPVVLVFYRDHGCGLCLVRLSRLEENRSAYGRLGARLLAVTSDSPEQVRRTSTELGLGFPVVSVPRATLAEWGVWPNEDSSPRPASIIVDAGGHVVFKHRGENSADRLSDVDLLAELRRVLQPPAFENVR
jgi:peroxiredoxin